MEKIWRITVSEHAVQTDSSKEGLESFVYDDQIVRMFSWATIIWGVVAMLVGVIIAIQLAFPAANLGIEFLSFGRLRPLHTNAADLRVCGQCGLCGYLLLNPAALQSAYVL